VKVVAAYVMRGRLQAAAVAGLCGVLSWVLPPVSYISGAVVALVSLRAGPREGLWVFLGAGLFCGLVAIFGLRNVLPAALTVTLWVPVWLSALILRSSHSQGVMLAAIGAMAATLATAVRLSVDDLDGWWREAIGRVLQETGATFGPGFDGSAVQTLAPMMNAFLASAIVLSLTLTMLLARWWQSLLYYPGGFRTEFEAIDLPPRLAWPVVIAAVYVGFEILNSAKPAGLVLDLLAVAVALYFFQGLAIAHHHVRAGGRSKAWLVALYLGLLVFPAYTVFALANVGLSDCVANFRRLPRDGGPGKNLTGE
jgi:hypothetical protein